MGMEKIKIKEEDLKILKYIANNARFNYVDIAHEFNLNVKTARNKIKQLEKEGVIQGYVTFLDPKKIKKCPLYGMSKKTFKTIIKERAEREMNEKIDKIK